jgi:DNA-binding NarL/FixJ family response regulator
MLVDLRLQGEVRRGLDLVAKLTSTLPSIKVIVLTGFDKKEYVFAALQAGAFGYLHKEAVKGPALLGHIEQAYLGDVSMTQDIAHRLIGFFRERTYQDHAEIQKDEALTQRERQVLELAAQGLTNKEIADRLDISWRTVKVHVSNILSKLRLESRRELWLYRAQSGLGGESPVQK